jgi:hypothetical protein
MMDNEYLSEWLFANGGPILRYRMAVDRMDGISQAEREQLLRDAIATPEVQRWLDNLRRSPSIHGSKDTNAENPLAKLLDYGLNRAVPAFDQIVQSLLNTPWKAWDDLILYPFLLRAGYADHPPVAECLGRRIELLYQTALRGDFDFYLSPAEASNVPKAWQGKPIYRDVFGSAVGYSLPTCYDFYALAYCPPVPTIENLSEKIDAIVAFFSDARFQSTVGGYGWDRDKKRRYAAGRVFLACVEPSRLVLFMELGARFAAARRSEWFQQGLATLNSYRTSQGTYRFPSSLLAEKNGYFIYSGSHMGMGEDRHSPKALELESTFRMLNILFPLPWGLGHAIG